MSTEPAQAEKRKSRRIGDHPDVVVLRRVRYEDYARLVEAPENYHLRMAYHDGTLEIVSPQIREHEEPAHRLTLIVIFVARHLGVRYNATAGGTFKKAGPGPYLGKGKEPDASFYITNAHRFPRDRELDLDAGDPPPDLWIEVDNRASSQGRLPVYAALGVPEVWRYRSRRKTLQFLALDAGSYRPIDRSPSLPDLTPALVLEVLALGDGLLESDWVPLLEAWIARTIPRPPAGF